MRTKKLLTLATIATLTFGVLTGCAGDDSKKSSSNENSSNETSSVSSNSADNTTIKVGASVTPHAEILNQAKEILAKDGINLEVVEIEDVVTPNTGVVEGSLDANYFQHQPYLDDFNKENKTELVSIGAIHYEPFAAYAGRTKSLADLEDGALVAVPNNTTNEARALLLLDQEGIIELKEDAGITATVNDIEKNPKNIEIKEIDPAQIARSLPDVDIAIMNGNYALEGGLHVKDALAVESSEGLAAQTYANIIVTTKEKENDEALKKLVEVLEGDEIQAYIRDTYEGAVVPLK